MGLKVTGLSGIGIKLSNDAKRASRGARDAMRRGANDIKDLSKNQAPVDEGNLEGAHEVNEIADGLGNRLTFEVAIDESAAAKGGGTVGGYVFKMHEGEYNLGDRSNQKARDLGLVVGPKFMERAFDELKDGIFKRVEEGVNRGIGK